MAQSSDDHAPAEEVDATTEAAEHNKDQSDETEEDYSALTPAERSAIQVTMPSCFGMPATCYRRHMHGSQSQHTMETYFSFFVFAQCSKMTLVCLQFENLLFLGPPSLPILTWEDQFKDFTKSGLQHVGLDQANGSASGEQPHRFHTACTNMY